MKWQLKLSQPIAQGSATPYHVIFANTKDQIRKQLFHTAHNVRTSTATSINRCVYRHCGRVKCYKVGVVGWLCLDPIDCQTKNDQTTPAFSVVLMSKFFLLPCW